MSDSNFIFAVSREVCNSMTALLVIFCQASDTASDQLVENLNYTQKNIGEPYPYKLTNIFDSRIWRVQICCCLTKQLMCYFSQNKMEQNYLLILKQSVEIKRFKVEIHSSQLNTSNTLSLCHEYMSFEKLFNKAMNAYALPHVKLESEEIHPAEEPIFSM